MRSGRFKKEARITTNIGHLTQVRFVVMEFPIPTRAEQDEIVRRFRELEALGLEAEINAGLARVAALRQSILEQAFSGRLVPQNPTDEPAAALLARLRDASAPARTRRRKTA
jgi:type I restriction enzyme S subunit